MTTDEGRVRQLAADLRVIARNDLTGGQRVCSKAAAILERLADEAIMGRVANAQPFGRMTSSAFAIDEYRKRVMGED